jgi:ubiquitin-like protein Pup
MGQKQAVKKQQRRTEEEPPQPTERVAVEDIDEILASVDAVLEENELEVTRTYIQKGGE